MLDNANISNHVRFPTYDFDICVCFRFFILGHSFSCCDICGHELLYKYPLVLLYCIENYIFVFQIVGFMEFIKEAGVSPQKSMDIKNDKITIKPWRDKDVDIFSKWLAKEYIYKWFCPDGEEHKMAWLDEVNNRNTQYHYMKHFIVYYNDKAIGFCLYLDCYFEKEYIPEHYGKTVDEKETVFEIGYLIGEEEYLGKGIGKIIVKKLIGEIAEIGGKEILADPDEANVLSIRTLLSNGFVKVKDCDYRYCLK